MKRIWFSVVCLIVLGGSAFAEEVKYTTHIRPLFEQRCGGCHGGDAPEYGAFKRDREKYKAQFKGPKMDSYAHLVSFTGWPDTGALMRRLDDGKSTKDNKPGNMYQYLGATEEERQKNLRFFKDWVGNWILKRLPEMTMEDLSGIKVNY